MAVPENPVRITRKQLKSNRPWAVMGLNAALTAGILLYTFVFRTSPLSTGGMKTLLGK